MAQPNSDHPVYIESVLNQKVKMLFSGIIFSITISAFLGLVLVVVQQPIIPLTTSLSWYGTLMSVVILRLILFNKWQSKDAKPKHDQKRWLQYFRSKGKNNFFFWCLGEAPECATNMPSDQTSKSTCV